jgi:hypothetical protein
MAAKLLGSETTLLFAAVEVHGMFKLIGNNISGFDEKDSAALWLAADPLGRTARSVYSGNVFQRCAVVVPESQKQSWRASNVQGNVIIE